MRTVIFFDFDRVLNDTDLLIDSLKAVCEQKGFCSKETYQDLYAEWSRMVRAPEQVAHLNKDELRRIVSLVYGLVPFIANRLNIDESPLRRAHEDEFSHNYLYSGAMGMLKQVDPNNLYILTAGGETDQWVKLRATGVDKVVKADHIAILQGKIPETFRRTITAWEIGPEDTIVHVNDRFNELVLAREAHKNIVSVWATWAHPNDIIPPYDISDLIVAHTIDECRSLLKEGGLFPEFAGKLSVEMG